MEIGSLISRISYENKTKIILFIIVAGIVLVGSFAQVRLYAMKQNFDLIYKKKILTLKNLEELKDIYDVNIFDTLLDIQKKQISIEEAKIIIRHAYRAVSRTWGKYKVDAAKKADFFSESINKII